MKDYLQNTVGMSRDEKLFQFIRERRKKVGSVVKFCAAGTNNMEAGDAIEWFTECKRETKETAIRLARAYHCCPRTK